MSAFDPFARFYDADYGTFDDDLFFYQELARRAGGRILEPMCGTGRVLLPLARAGLRVTGVDISTALLDRARARLDAAGLLDRVELLRADIREAAPEGPFGLAVVALNSLMHLTETGDQLAALQNVHQALRPAGLLAIDVYNPDPRELTRHNGELVLDKSFTLEDGTQVQKFVAQTSDPATQTSQVTFLYDELGADGHLRRHTLPFTMRWVYRYELEHLLARAGFALEAVYGTYELEDYSSDSPIMLTVARKA